MDSEPAEESVDPADPGDPEFDPFKSFDRSTLPPGTTLVNPYEGHVFKGKTVAERREEARHVYDLFVAEQVQQQVEAAREAKKMKRSAVQKARQFESRSDLWLATIMLIGLSVLVVAVGLYVLNGLRVFLSGDY